MYIYASLDDSLLRFFRVIFSHRSKFLSWGVVSRSDGVSNLTPAKCMYCMFI